MRQNKTHKITAMVLLAAILIFAFTPILYADTEPILNNSDTSKYAEANPPNYAEKLVAGTVISLAKFGMNLMKLSDPVLLVFNKDVRVDTSDPFLAEGIYGQISPDDMVLEIFPKPFFNAMSILYTGFEKLLPIPLVIAVTLIALIYMLNSGSTEGRSKLKDYTKAFIVALLVIRFGYYIWYAFIEINDFLINLIWAYLLDHGIQPGFFMDMIWGTGRDGFNQVSNMGSLPMALILLLAIMMIIVLNYQYTLRIVILGMLIVTFPIVAAITVFPGFRHSLQIWAQEFVANVIMGLAHAVALGVFFLALNQPGIGESISFWLMITYFVALPSIVTLVRQIIGLRPGNAGFMGGVGTVMGIAAIAGIGHMFKRGTSDSGNTATSGILPNNLATGMDTEPLMPGGGSSGIGKSFGGRLGGGILKAGAKGAAVTVSATAALAGATIEGMATGNPMSGALLGAGGTTMALSKGGKIANTVGGQIKAGVEGFSSGGGIKGAGESIMARSMANDGMLANAGWGLQSAVNKLSTTFSGEEVFAGPSYIANHKEMLSTANKGMESLSPQINSAYAEYNHSLQHHGASNERTKKLKEHYQNLKNNYNTHQADSLLAQTKLRSYSDLKDYAAYSRAGGRL